MCEGKIIKISKEGILFEKEGELYVAYPYCSCWSGYWWLCISKATDQSLPYDVKKLVEEVLK